MNRYLWYMIDALICTAIAAVAFVGGAFITVGVLGIHNDMLVYSSMSELAAVMFVAKHVIIEKHVTRKMKKEVTSK